MAALSRPVPPAEFGEWLTGWDDHVRSLPADADLGTLRVPDAAPRA